MPASVPISISLLLVTILSSTHGKDIEESCNVDNSAGVCKSLQDCPSVYQELLAGKIPKGNCGFNGFNPIVCCPTTNKRITESTTESTTTTTTTTRNLIRPLALNGSRGSVARAKCAEAAKAVYGFILPPTSYLHKQPVNVSLCGFTTKKLIVGGKAAEAKEFPHMAAIGFDTPDGNIVWPCGGSLISKKIVLTAAHCMWTPDWGKPKWVRLGDLNLKETNDQAMPQTIAIADRIQHPDYKKPSEYHDIAILRLEKEAEYNAFVRPACLPVDLPDINENENVVATGWGLVDWSHEKGSDSLLKVTISVVSHETCNASFFDGISLELPDGIVNEWQICAGEDGKDTCQGDSGGPIAVFNDVHYCMYNIVGITSLGRDCGSISPGVYTRVYNYIPWIERTAWPEYF
ncbi:hypothetical protein PUN28_012836 [Cardiocondyla obscurior]|uniref:Uncharacterized protein n=1 Tax=Cardiocondyla obscurior TaxID=286306 RepID=A0AAW2F7J3_9HYME